MKAFECQMCGECCYGKGGIFVKKHEIENIACFLGIETKDFISRYCETTHNRFHIKTGEDGYCIFLVKGAGCLIHPVKPEICSLWPFYPAIIKDIDNWKMAQDACPGINPGCPFDEFVKQAKKFRK